MAIPEAYFSIPIVVSINQTSHSSTKQDLDHHRNLYQIKAKKGTCPTADPAWPEVRCFPPLPQQWHHVHCSLDCKPVTDLNSYALHVQHVINAAVTMSKSLASVVMSRICEHTTTEPSGHMSEVRDVTAEGSMGKTRALPILELRQRNRWLPLTFFYFNAFPASTGVYENLWKPL